MHAYLHKDTVLSEKREQQGIEKKRERKEKGPIKRWKDRGEVLGKRVEREWGELWNLENGKSIGIKKERKLKWFVSWISFNIFQEVKLRIRITFDYFWLLHLFL